jgi:hypothetical protein
MLALTLPASMYVCVRILRFDLLLSIAICAVFSGFVSAGTARVFIPSKTGTLGYDGKGPDGSA